MVIEGSTRPGLTFDEYMQIIGRNQNYQTDKKINELRRGHIGLGLDERQMEVLLQVSRAFKLLPFKEHTVPGGPKTVTLDRMGILGLATIAGLGFNSIAHEEGKGKTKTLRDLYPRVQKTVSGIYIALEEYYGIYGALPEFEALREVIANPAMPKDPSKEVSLSSKPFNPSEYLPTNQQRRGSTVSELHKATHYGIRPRIIT